MKGFFGCVVLILLGGAVSAQIQTGLASYYSDALAGNKTACGDKYRPSQLTAAHKSLPFHTMVRVLNLENGREISVRINDRGPFVKGRIIDLSRSAAEALGIIRQGIAKVRIEVVPQIEFAALTAKGTTTGLRVPPAIAESDWVVLPQPPKPKRHRPRRH